MYHLFCIFFLNGTSYSKVPVAILAEIRPSTFWGFCLLNYFKKRIKVRQQNVISPFQTCCVEVAHFHLSCAV